MTKWNERDIATPPAQSSSKITRWFRHRGPPLEGQASARSGLARPGSLDQPPPQSRRPSASYHDTKPSTPAITRKLPSLGLHRRASPPLRVEAKAGLRSETFLPIGGAVGRALTPPSPQMWVNGYQMRLRKIPRVRCQRRNSGNGRTRGEGAGEGDNARVGG